MSPLAFVIVIACAVVALELALAYRRRRVLRRLRLKVDGCTRHEADVASGARIWPRLSVTLHQDGRDDVELLRVDYDELPHFQPSHAVRGVLHRFDSRVSVSLDFPELESFELAEVLLDARVLKSPAEIESDRIVERMLARQVRPDPDELVRNAFDAGELGPTDEARARRACGDDGSEMSRSTDS